MEYNEVLSPTDQDQQSLQAERFCTVPLAPLSADLGSAHNPFQFHPYLPLFLKGSYDYGITSVSITLHCLLN